MGTYKFTNPASGKSFDFKFTPPPIPRIPVGGFNPEQVAIGRTRLPRKALTTQQSQTTTMKKFARKNIA